MQPTIKTKCNTDTHASFIQYKTLHLSCQSKPYERWIILLFNFKMDVVM